MTTLNYEQQKEAFIDLIRTLKGVPVSEGVVVRLPEWSDYGFPHALKVYAEYADSSKSNMDLHFHLDDNGNWSKVSIFNLDVEKRLQHKHRGTTLVNLALEMAEAAGAAEVSGECFVKEDGYSSAQFYEHLGAVITMHGNMPPTFSFKL